MHMHMRILYRCDDRMLHCYMCGLYRGSALNVHACTALKSALCMHVHVRRFRPGGKACRVVVQPHENRAHALAAAPAGALQPVWKARDDLAARQRHHHGACFGAIASRSDTHVTATQQICMQKHTRRGEGATVSMSKPAAPAIHPSRHSSLFIQRYHLISSIHMLR